MLFRQTLQTIFHQLNVATLPFEINGLAHAHNQMHKISPPHFEHRYVGLHSYRIILLPLILIREVASWLHILVVVYVNSNIQFQQAGL